MEAEKYGSRIITAKEVFDRGMEFALQEIPEADNIYVTFDIDVLDHSIALELVLPNLAALITCK